MNCPHCSSKTQVMFDPRQNWCSVCGVLLWMNPDGTIRHTYIPERQKIDQRTTTKGNGGHS